MARDTNRLIKANLKNPVFRKRLEEAKGMAQQGNKKKRRRQTTFSLL